MTPEKRREQRRNEDASFRARASLENERLQERIKALESLLARCAVELPIWQQYYDDHSEYQRDEETDTTQLISEIDAILPKTEEVK